MAPGLNCSRQRERAFWSKEPTVFTDAAALGLQAEIVGWYHPYCRILGSTVSVCREEPTPVWAPDPFAWREYAETIGFWRTLSVEVGRILFLVPRYERFDHLWVPGVPTGILGWYVTNTNGAFSPQRPPWSWSPGPNSACCSCMSRSLTPPRNLRPENTGIPERGERQLPRQSQCSRPVPGEVAPVGGWEPVERHHRSHHFRPPISHWIMVRRPGSDRGMAARFAGRELKDPDSS